MDELAYIKKLAGVNEFKGYTEYQIDENPSMKAPVRAETTLLEVCAEYGV